MAAGCLKAILVILNIFFLIVGLALLGLGVALKVGGDMIKTFAQSALGSIPSMQTGVGLVDSQVQNAQQAANNAVTVGTDAQASFDLGPFLDSFITAFIIFGVFITVLSILAFIGGCCGIRIVLIIYAVIVGLIFLTHLIMVILLYTGAIDGTIKDNLKGTIKDHYTGIDGKDAVTLIWNFAMLQYKCCGVETYKDFDGATKWKKERSFSVASVTVTKSLVTPIACCQYTGTFPSVQPVTDVCAFIPTNTTSNWFTGCFGKLQSEVLSLINAPSVGVIAAVLVVECVMAVLAVAIVLLTRNKIAPV